MLAISDMSYPFKSTRREELNSLKDGLPQGAEVIILKKGNLTDTTYSNLAFWDGTHWYTPSSPLLPGTMRAQLLEDGKMLECPITPRNLSKFSHFKCINAMNNLKEAPTYAIQCIQEHK
ncbi:MAG: aminotransferase class IV [Saprospiraceae bacterium]|nr:aminotransferase class IV [Saprospiraceae bacterium]